MIKQSEFLRRGDFQILIILDACRLDIFQEVIQEYDQLKGVLHEVDSEATCTPHWYNKHWSHKNKVVLISANPQPWWKGANFAARNFRTNVRAWNEDNDTNRVNSTLRYLLNYIKKSEGDTHYMVHCVPPHLPFLGEKGVELFDSLTQGEKVEGQKIYRLIEKYGRETGDWGRVRECYKENLRIALVDIIENMSELKNYRVVITSDHGELIGEDGLYDHLSNPRTIEQEKILRTVPYYEIL